MSEDRPSRREAGGWGRDQVDAFCEKGVLFTVLAMLFFGVVFTGAARDWQFLVLLGLGLVLIGFWLARIWLRRQYRFLCAPIGLFVVAFTGYAIWRYTWVDIEYLARLELLQIILYAVLFFAVLDNLSSQENIQILLFALIGLAVLNAFYAVFQYFTDSQRVLWYYKPLTYRGRGSGTYICPNHLAGFLEMMLPVALAYTVLGRHKPLPKVFLGYAAVAMVAGLGVTISRGGYLSAGLSLFLFFVVLLWNRTYRLPAIAILVVMLAAGSFFGFKTWQSQKRFADLQQHNMRLKYWGPAVELWKQNFWFGVGAGHYDWRFRPWRFWKLQGRPMYVHNDYLNTVTEYGATGGLLALGALGALGWGVLRSWKFVRRTNEISSKPSNRQAVVLGCSIGMLALVFHSVTDFNLHIPGNAMVAVVLMGILSTHWRFATEKLWVNPGVIGKFAGSLALLAAAGYLGWNLSRLAPQEYWLAKYKGGGTFDEQVGWLEKSHQAEPKNSTVTIELGELLRKKGWEGKDGWQKWVKDSMPWFEKGISLNRWNPYNYMNLGMCQHWLKDRAKAAEYFETALQLDPKSYYMLAMFGWHLVQIGDWAGARKYFQESYSYYWDDNPIAKQYLELVDRRLAEQAKKP